MIPKAGPLSFLLLHIHWFIMTSRLRTNEHFWYVLHQQMETVGPRTRRRARLCSGSLVYLRP